MKRFAWPALLAVLVVVFVIGSWPQHTTARTPVQRVQHLSAEIRCPTCRGLSVAESDSPLAASAKQEIERRVADGESDAAIEAYFVSRYGDNALMSPERNGVVDAAWFIPVAVGVVLIAGVVFAVWQWRRRDATARTAVTDEDRRLVDTALGQR